MCTPNNAVIQQERMHNAWHPDTDRSTGTFLPHCADRSSRSSSPSHLGPQRRHWERPMPATRGGRPRCQKAGRQGNDDTVITVLAWWYSLSLSPSFPTFLSFFSHSSFSSFFSFFYRFNSPPLHYKPPHLQSLPHAPAFS